MLFHSILKPLTISEFSWKTKLCSCSTRCRCAPESGAALTACLSFFLKTSVGSCGRHRDGVGAPSRSNDGTPGRGNVLVTANCWNAPQM